MWLLISSGPPQTPTFQLTMGLRSSLVDTLYTTVTCTKQLEACCGRRQASNACRAKVGIATRIASTEQDNYCRTEVQVKSFCRIKIWQLLMIYWKQMVGICREYVGL